MTEEEGKNEWRESGWSKHALVFGQTLLPRSPPGRAERGTYRDRLKGGPQVAGMLQAKQKYRFSHLMVPCLMVHLSY